MAVTLVAPSTSENNTIVVVLTSDNGDLLSVNPNDFSLWRTDTGAQISADIAVMVGPRAGPNFTWNVTVQNLTNYAGGVYLQARASAFIERINFARVPISPLNSNEFAFTPMVAPVEPVAPSTPVLSSITVIDENSVRLNLVASTGTVTQYQYQYATSEGGLVSAIWRDGGTTTTIIVGGLPPSTTLYFRVRAANQSVFSGASAVVSATTASLPPPPAVGPVIEAVDSPVNVLINTPSNLPVKVTNATHAWAEGDLIQGGDFSHSFENDVLTLKGTGKALQSDVGVILKALNGDESAELPLIYNIVPAAPIFGALPNNFKVYRGTDFQIFVLIFNQPGDTRVRGPWIGITSGEFDDGVELGVRIFGPVPTDDTWTLPASARRFDVQTGNEAGTIQTTEDQLNFTIVDGTPPALGAVRFTISGSSLQFRWDAVTDALLYQYSTEEGADVAWRRSVVTAADFGDVIQEGVSPPDFLFRARVGSPWIGAESSVRLATPSAPQNFRVVVGGSGPSRTFTVHADPPADLGNPVGTLSYIMEMTSPLLAVPARFTIPSFPNNFASLPTPSGSPATFRMQAVNGYGPGEYTQTITLSF